MPFDTTDLDTSRFDFPVSMRPLSYRSQDGELVEQNFDDHYAVVNEVTGQVLAIQGRRYELTPHTKVFDQLSRAILDSGLPLDNMRVDDQLLAGGAVARRTVTLPQLFVQPRVGDVVQFCFTMLNSYNGQYAYQLGAGALRLACLNGMKLPSGFQLTSRIRHTREIEVEVEATKLGRALEAIQGSNGVWEVWANQRVSHGDVRQLVETTIAAAPTRAEPQRFNKRLANELLRRYDAEAQNMGPTLWSLYNAGTAWATHGELSGRARDAEMVRMRRDDQVAKMVNSDQWALLEAA